MPTISERIVTATEQLETDAGLHHDIVHGGISDFITTEGGPVRSLANAVNTITNTNPRGAWATATAYALRDVVIQGGIAYLCVVAHTSGTFATDLAAVKWVVYQGALVSDLVGDSGAENIGFKAPGTGAVLRNVGARLKETLSIKDFGAAGNGSADDRAKIQLAIDYCAANKIKLTIPTGVFRMTMAAWGGTDPGVYCLQLKSGLHLCGESKNGSILKLADEAFDLGAYHRMFLTESSAPVEDIVLENFTIDGNRANQEVSQNGGNILFGPITNGTIMNVVSKGGSGQGIQLANSLTILGQNLTVKGCYVDDCSYIGIQCAQFDRLSIIDNEVTNCDDNAIDVYGEDGTTTCRARQFIIKGNRIKGCSSGIFLETVREGICTDNIIDDCTTYGIISNRINGEPSTLKVAHNLVTSTPVGMKVSGDSDGVIVSNNDFIGFTTAGVVLGNTGGNVSYAVVKDNYFKPPSDSVNIIMTEGTQCAFCLVKGNTVNRNEFPQEKLFVATADTHFSNQVFEFNCIPAPIGRDLVRATGTIGDLATTTAAIGTVTSDTIFTGVNKLATGNQNNIGPLTYELELPNIKAGRISISTYQSGVGRQVNSYIFVKNGTVLVISDTGTAVTGGPPVSSIVANGAGNLDLVLPYPNTYVAWSITELNFTE